MTYDMAARVTAADTLDFIMALPSCELFLNVYADENMGQISVCEVHTYFCTLPEQNRLLHLIVASYKAAIIETF